MHVRSVSAEALSRVLSTTDPPSIGTSRSALTTTRPPRGRWSPAPTMGTWARTSSRSVGVESVQRRRA